LTISYFLYGDSIEHKLVMYIFPSLVLMMRLVIVCWTYLINLLTFVLCSTSCLYFKMLLRW